MYRLSAASASRTFSHHVLLHCEFLAYCSCMPAWQCGAVGSSLTEKTQHPISFGQKFAEIFEEENSEIQFSSIVLI